MPDRDPDARVIALESIGLGGDGDEVVAIEAAFARFGFAVPVDDAPGWLTVGHVWRSLRELVPGIEAQPKAWEHLVETLCAETGAEPAQVGMETRLLA